jgi:hypothetical protein
MDKIGIAADFLRVLRFPLPIVIPPTTLQSSSTIRCWYNRPNSGRSTKWTRSHPTPRKKNKPEDEHSTSSETWVNIYQNPRRNIPEDSNLHSYNLGILKPQEFVLEVSAVSISVG